MIADHATARAGEEALASALAFRAAAPQVAPMAVQLNHTIVHVDDAQASATFLAEILGLPAPRRFGPFVVVDTGNG